MTGFVDVFTNSNLYASDITYAELDLTANVELSWPLEAPTGATLLAQIMDVTSDAAYTITLPNAAAGSTGATVLLNNLSAYTIAVNDASAVQVASVAPGTQVQLYLADNNSIAGVWRAYQLGASVAVADASALAGNGLRAVGSQLWQSVNAVGFTGSFTLVASDAATSFNWVGTGGGITVTLPNAVSVGSTWFVRLRNSGDSVITLAAAGAQTVNDQSSISLNIGDSALIACDGTNFFTVGLGKDATFAFDYTSIDVSGGTDYTLTGNQLNRIAYNFTGTLTADITIIVPATVQQYWVQNSTAGGFVLSIATATQITPVALPDAGRNIYYCDGSNVTAAVSANAIVGSISGGSF